MTYFQGFVVPVKTGNKQAYLDMAKKVALDLRRIWRDGHR